MEKTSAFDADCPAPGLLNTPFNKGVEINRGGNLPCSFAARLRYSLVADRQDMRLIHASPGGKNPAVFCHLYLFPPPNFPRLIPALIFAVLALTFVPSARAQKWVTNAPLIVPRWNQTATLLTNGSIFVAGGTIYNTNGNYANTSSCEIYLPSAGASTLAAAMADNRDSHAAVLLKNGQVLIAGGGGDSSSELYDPASDSWVAFCQMNAERVDATAALLPNGQVLVAGGYNDNTGNEESSGELYDPTSATWTSTPAMPYGADSAAAALLQNGLVLVCGGSSNGSAVSNAVLYYPANNTWSNTAPMNEARAGHTATLLASGKVLVEAGTFDNSAEVYDPVTAKWTLAASMNDGRLDSEAVLLTNGQVMVMGDGNTDVELYDPVADQWNYTGSLPVGGNHQTATLLANGAVVVMGGSVSEYNGPPLAVVETYGAVVTAPGLAVTNWPTNGLVPLTVHFTSPSVDGAGNTVTNWNWTFGDGATSTTQSPSHTYSAVGSYSPGLVAYSSFGALPLSVSGLTGIAVTNNTLTVTATPEDGPGPLTVQFNSPGVDSAGNTVTNWSWTFGDGSNSSARSPVHVYGSFGTFFASLVAYSTGGNVSLSITGPGAITVTNAPNASFVTIYEFSSEFGIGPNAGLVLAGNTLYGTTGSGGTGSGASGTVFAVNTDGTGFTNLYVFTPDSGSVPLGLTLSGGRLFGATYGGGSQGGGTVFGINTNGTGFSNIYDFTFLLPSTGTEPQATVVSSGGTLYGTTQYGGAYDAGTVFAVSTNGAITDLHSFYTPSGDYRINSDGDGPFGKLILADGTLYGTTEAGGISGYGVVFSVNTNDPGSFRVLHYFTSAANYRDTNLDGANPFSGLVLAGGTLYGTTYGGGTNGNGTVFAVNTNATDPSGFTNLYNFTGRSDGGNPKGNLILAGNTLYGSVPGGGAFGNGALFAINTDGSAFTNLYSFTGGSDGSEPQGDLILAGGTLYGSAASGGSAGDGTIFSFALPYPLLQISSASTNILLYWSTLASGYRLQSSSQLGPGAIWNPVSPLPVIVNGRNVVTNTNSAQHKFYRLAN